MTMVSIRRDVWGPDGLLARREPFTTYGAMSADGYATPTGRLPNEWVTRYRADDRNPGIVYTVRSWATPIAWVRADGEVIIPDESYSRTTTRHQNLCRVWLA